MKGKYDDIIDMPHHVSPRRPRMSREERAAQFMPFMALTGYADVIRETERLTDERPELSESVKEELGRKLHQLCSASGGHPEAAVTYFRPDARKAGGALVTVTGRLKRIDRTEGIMKFEDGREILLEDVTEIESPE